MILELGVLISTGLVLIYVWLTWHYSHWKNLGIPYLEPSLFFGNVKDFILMKQCKGLVYNDLYRQGDGPVLGIYTMRQPQLLIRDAALFKILTVNEFHCFTDLDIYTEPTDFFHSTHVFFLKGNKWKVTRGKVSPALTVSKLKSYFPQMKTACSDMIDYLRENTDTELDAKRMSGMYSMDIVMSCVYGLSSNSYKDPETKYWNALNNVLDPGFWPYLKFTIASTIPPIGHFFKIGLTPNKLVDFFVEIVREAVSYRKSNNVRRNDFLQYVLDNSGKDGAPEYSIWDITGLTFNVTMDASETTALVLSLIIDVLLRHPEEMKKLQEEIDKKVTSVDDITYENINSIPYLNAFVSESLRIRTPIPLTERVCTKDCEISFEGKTYKFKKGDKFVGSLYAMNMDHKYFPDPEEFRPERFLHSDDHLGYYPFGLGPRACLGRVLGTMEVKLFLCGLLKYFEVMPSRELTPKVQFDNLAHLGLLIKDGVWIKVKKRQGIP